MSRCIARISGEKGKTKNAIENATKTRLILADSTIHLMGSYANIRAARDALCSLIMGTPPGKVYSQLKYVSKRLNEKFWYVFQIIYHLFSIAKLINKIWLFLKKEVFLIIKM